MIFSSVAKRIAVDDACRAAEAECVRNPSATASGCQAASVIQPCNWDANANGDPTLLGQKIYTLPSGIPIDDAFPNPCAAGVLGSAEIEHQTSAACKEPCPAGYTCPSEATLQPVDCPAGYYCPAGSVRPVACPGGTSNGALRAASVEACIDVPPGYWAPVGSAAPEVCPASGFFCPGKLQDETHGGAKPVLLVGGSTTTQQVDVVEKTMTLALTCADFDLDKVKAALAEQYDCPVELITLSNPCASRRLRALQSGIAITITIASTATAADGSTVSAPIASLMSAVQTVDDTALGSSLSSALGTTIAVSSAAPTQATAIATVSLVCPRGKWCTAGLVVDCPLNTYNNETGQDFATACKLCPANSRTLHKGTANASGQVRAMLDFAFVDPLHIPGTYCGCVLEELGERQLKLCEADVWAA